MSTCLCEKTDRLHSDTGNGEMPAISRKWKRRLTSFAQVLAHPGTVDASSHTEAGKQSAMETHRLGSCGGEDELLQEAEWHR
ncbi:hypothetical protein VZT92_006058 [Zoarces viviparus]|uniref:Uncharacterized protein n=1 Tax=Zoarces viviparus TaxID=48416 RepID=A0AAW1FPF1_ZOAVI